MIPLGASLAAAVLLTYAAQSTAACAIALAVTKFLRRPHDRDIVWKAALVAPFLTTTASFVADRFPGSVAAIDVADVVRRHVRGVLPARRLIVEMTVKAGDTTVLRRLTDPVAATLSEMVLVVALVAIVLAGLRLVVRRRALRRAVASRGDGQATGRTTHGRQVVVSSCDALQSPIALGNAEICLPTVVAVSFDDAKRRALLAHEAAHLERRDPAWLVTVDTIAALSAFQPLVFAVTRALRRDAELICDEAALRETGDRGALIGALALLAVPFDPRASCDGAASAVDGSPLVARAARIASLSLGADAVRSGTAVAGSMVMASALLCVLPVIAPAVWPRDGRLGRLGRLGAAGRVERVEQERVREVR